MGAVFCFAKPKTIKLRRSIMRRTVWIVFAVILLVRTCFAEWETTIVDSSGYFSGRCDIAVDSDNHPAICYCKSIADNPGLYCAFYDGSNWNIEIADSGWDFKGLSITFDQNNYPHISYGACYPSYDLRHAWKDAEGWHYEILDTSGFGSSNYLHCSSIVTDANNHIHIAYSVGGDLAGRGIQYAFWDGSSWSLNTLLSDGSMTCLSTDVDTNNYPHITDWLGVYCKFNGADWEIDTLDFAEYGGVHLRLDSQNRPNIVYCDAFGNVFWAYYDGSWVIDSVGVSAQGSNAPFDLDMDDYVHIIYHSVPDTSLRYVTNTSEDWTDEVICIPDNVIGSQASGIAVDGSGNIHVCDSDISPSYMKLIRYHHRAGSGIKEPEDETRIPESRLVQNYPNPFNSSCAIIAPSGATIEIYNLYGKCIGTFDKTPCVWEPDESISSGIYLIRAIVGNRIITKRAIIIK